MTQEIKLGKDSVILNSEVKYLGTDNPQDEEKLVRKALGLPITKQLKYYIDKRNVDSVINITEFQLVEMYDITEPWYTVEISLEDGAKVLIHSSYLVEMQKPNFIADMAKQMA